MKKYRVIALSVGGVHNQIFKSGDVVSALDFEIATPNPTLVSLIKGRYVKSNEDGTYTVIALSVNINGVIRKSGDLITNDDLPTHVHDDNTADALVEKGFLERIEE